MRRALAGLLVALFHSVATAQLSGTASVLSDYRYRGVSLSDNKPAIQLGLAYDDPNGWYAGLFASSVRYTEPSERGVQAIYYVGHAWRTAAGQSFEAGASYSIVSGERGYDYPEVFVGFTADPVSARLYYSPRYAGYDADTLYAEVNAAQALADRVRLLAHVGVLRSPVTNLYFYRPDYVVDGRVGFAIAFDRFSVQLAWVGISSSAAYPFDLTRHRNTAVIVLSTAF